MKNYESEHVNFIKRDWVGPELTYVGLGSKNVATAPQYSLKKNYFIITT